MTRSVRSQTRCSPRASTSGPGERLVHRGTDQHTGAGDVDAGRLKYGSSLAPGANGLALPEDLVQQDRLLDVPVTEVPPATSKASNSMERAVAAVRFTIVALAPAPSTPPIGAMTRTVTPSLAMAFSRSGAARSTCVC